MEVEGDPTKNQAFHKGLSTLTTLHNRMRALNLMIA